MSSFTAALIVRVEQRERSGRGLYTLVEPFTYQVGTENSGKAITVRKGFETDFASIPWFARWLISPSGLHAKAALIHDGLYRGVVDLDGLNYPTRSETEAIFKEAMQVLNVPKTRRLAIFCFVRIFGGRVWKNLKQSREKNQVRFDV